MICQPCGDSVRLHAPLTDGLTLAGGPKSKLPAIYEILQPDAGYVMMTRSKTPMPTHGRRSRDVKMTDDNELAGSTEHVPESLRKLAEYLERSLDKATSIVMMRHTASACTVYLGDPEGLREDVKQIGTIAIPLANDMLESTCSGANKMHVDGQVYRFVRSFTQVGDMAAVVFSTK